jgi:hypothetical protein
VLPITVPISLLFGNLHRRLRQRVLQDLVNDDIATVRVVMPFEDFKASPGPGTLDAYFAYRQGAIEFIESRNHWIAAHVGAWPLMNSAAKAVIAG